MERVLKVHPKDNLLVALTDLFKGEIIIYNDEKVTLLDDVKAKHKFLTANLKQGEEILMYGVLVGKAQIDLKSGNVITTVNIKHAANSFEVGERNLNWDKPDISKWANTTFNGFHRKDGSVGTANYWLVIPMVFCENRNLEVLQEALITPLGYGRKKAYQNQAIKLIDLYQAGANMEAILNADIFIEDQPEKSKRLFPNVDGIKFLNHDGGCGGIRQDAETLCGLLAGYITHPNVAGATVLSLGCQNAQVPILEAEIKKRDPNFSKPLYVLDQQKVGTEADLLALAIKQTFAGLMEANLQERKPAPLSQITIGLECGGSDGFSGISANPAIGYTSDLLVALGGKVILAEFPELCGVEQNISDRCVTAEEANRFSSLMKIYAARAVEAG